MRVAVGRRERSEDRLAMPKRRGRTADHEAVAIREPVDPATRSDIHELDPVCVERLRTAHRIAKVRVAAVDDDVPSFEMRDELPDGALDRSACRDHYPQDPAWRQLPGDIR